MIDTHISDEDLAVYAESAKSCPNRTVIEAHLAQCDECFHAVVLLREFRDMQSAQLLESKPKSAKAAHASAAKQATRPEESPGADGASLLGLGALLAGALGFSSRRPMAGTSALASSAPGTPDKNQGLHHFSSEAERNLHDGSSVAAEGHGIQHFHPAANTEGHHVGDTYDSSFQEAKKTYGWHSAPGRSDYVHQHYADTCAVQCQRLILNEFGVDVTEDQLTHEATSKGLYTPGEGTRLEDVGKLLESHGVAVHREQNANVFNLATELAMGHKVIVGLDSGELWHTNTLLNEIARTFGIGGADHAVIVSGIDTSDPAHPRVVVTDPGTGDVAKTYPLSGFLDAWKGSHFSMVATTIPAPRIDPAMVNFNYDAGHIAHVGAMPYELAHEMAAQAAHENDPSIVHRLENAFMHVVSGEVPVHYLVEALGGIMSPAHISFQSLADGLVAMAHEGLNAQGWNALFSSAIGQDFDHLFHGESFSHHGPHDHEIVSDHHALHHDVHSHHEDGTNVDDLDHGDPGDDFSDDGY